MSKLVPIIEYQEDRQRTPQELIDHLQKELDKEDITQMFVYYKNVDKGLQSYATASKNRDYCRSSILWDIVGWMGQYRFTD